MKQYVYTMMLCCVVAISIMGRSKCAMQKSINSDVRERMVTFYKDKRVLVTGGCGFIGSHAAQMLVDLGAQVTNLDNLETGRIENISSFKDCVTLIQDTIVNREVCLRAVRDVEIVFHFAAFISVPKSTEEPYACHATNVDGIVHLLEASRLANKPRFVFSSSAATYGNTQEPCSELTPTDPQSPYAWSKLIGEQYCKQYAQMYGMKTISMRYFNVYGPRQNPHAAYAAAVAKFSYNMQHNENITFFGDGLQTRDFVPVSTVVETNLLLGMLPDEYLDGSVYNVATGKSINLFELFEMLKKEYPRYNQEIRFAPARPGDVKHAIADCKKIATLCNVLHIEQ